MTLLFLFFYFHLLKKIRLDVSCGLIFHDFSSARQRIPMKHQALFSLKNNEKVFMKAICCSRDWDRSLRVKGLLVFGNHLLFLVPQQMNLY